MTRRGDETHPKTILDHVRPTVVVRRRVEEMPKRTAEDHEDGPPSSVDVARALASLRGDDLRRLDALMKTDDDAVTTSVAPREAPPSRPTLRIGPTIVLSDLARRMGTTSDELITALVTRGFFSIHAKSALSRETAREAAAAFGWNVEDDPDVADTTPAHRRAPAKKKGATARTKRGGSRSRR
jgi:hypothetical protein